MSKKATIDRMVAPDYLCPWGLKALDLLKREGFEVEDHHIPTEEDNKAYKAENHVDETPQIYIEGERVGGYDDLRERLGKKAVSSDDTSYTAVIVIFTVASLLALGASYARLAEPTLVLFAELFVAFSMVLLGLMKLCDLESFSVQFLTYDLLAQRKLRYAYVYPFVETGAGLAMFAGVLWYLAAPAALIIGLVGATSVIMAVYIDKRELRCACVGGGSKVPLGLVSMTDNLMKIVMAIWLLMTRA
ncbi:glutaredoxin [Pelagicoccus sp. SDUM812002]|uniref:glutaredoxin family protein n=1 Tax=Pelagicoccus sp. SDUM812002 TaxID=3041266 RepID=UPI00281062C9|nr:glutaredoxin [Pelagicoccus sp. SDUM812002]MDQ8186409.1 glutaredoxin [Pelagicoccus sp. SDUM812002]